MTRFVLILLTLLVSCPSFAALPVPPGLEPHVEFWLKIYTQYTTRQGLIHDARYIDKVYEVLDFSAPEYRRLSSSELTRRAKAKWKKLLYSVHTKQNAPEKMDAEERRLFELYNNVDEPNKFLAAAHRKRLRFQLGQSDRFRQGIVHSGKYISRMEEIFEAEGLPVELTRLPFVESSFNIQARSKVGASGIWQFMPSTGKLFLRIDGAIDERNDPIRATEAAAKLMKLNHGSLGNWPLAVTAYNHGRKSLMRAVRKLGSSNLEDLVLNFKYRTFGFASSNFYACLLAAIQAYENRSRYFGTVVPDSPPNAYEVLLPEPVAIPELVRFFKLNLADLKTLNPGVHAEVFRGEMLFPALATLRLPYDPTTTNLKPDALKRVFLAGFEQIPPVYKTKVAPRLSSGKASHRVQN